MATLMVFSKHLGKTLDQAIDHLALTGIRRIDLTVRPGGHIDPARVQDDLPQAIEKLQARGMAIGMLTTQITDAHDPTAQRVLETAAKFGVKHYKLGYFMYDRFGTLKAQRESVKSAFRDLAQLNGQLGLVGGYHNHCDNFFGANLADIAYALDNLSPKHLGFYFDPTHAMIEGGCLGWKMGLELLADRVVMLAAKDYRWVDCKHRYAGGRRQSVEFHPFAGGNTPWLEVLTILKPIGFDGPISLHSEYQTSHAFADLSCRDVALQTAHDMTIFGPWLSQAGFTLA